VGSVRGPRDRMNWSLHQGNSGERDDTGRRSPFKTVRPLYGHLEPSMSRRKLSNQETLERERLNQLLRRSHTLNGAVLVGLDGLIIEIQARAMSVIDPEEGVPWRQAVTISGMATGAVGGVGVFSALAGAMSTVFLAPAVMDEETEIRAMRSELNELRRTIEERLPPRG